MTTPAESAVASLLAQATGCLAAAWATAYMLADDDRQAAEQRAGVDAGDAAVLDDPEYRAVLDRCRRLHELADTAERVAKEWT